MKVTLDDIGNHLKLVLHPKGTANVARISFNTSINAAFFDYEFVVGVIDDMVKALKVAECGLEPLSKLEQIGIHLLLSSAYYNSFDDLNAAVIAQKKHAEKHGDMGNDWENL